MKVSFRDMDAPASPPLLEWEDTYFSVKVVTIPREGDYVKVGSKRLRVMNVMWWSAQNVSVLLNNE